MSVEQYEQPLARVADVLQNDPPAALLIGAGCSVSAGIPSGSGFARLIRERYTSVEADGYADCMDQLPKPQQKDLIQEKIGEADVNWAHVAIAQLIDHRYVDRILTTNFDPLIARACALINRFPAIYDYAAAPGTFNPGTVSDPSVFHLHGQGTGFVLKNSQSEMSELEDALPELLEDTLRDHPLVVVGYGAGDPVFDALVAHGYFQHELYWITYERSDPPDHIKTRLLDGCDNAYFVRGSDADEFFIRLTRNLNCFPPAYVEKPFSHQLELLDSLTEFPSLGSDKTEVDGKSRDDEPGSSDVSSPSLEDESGDDIMQDAEEMIQEAATRYEEGIQAMVNRARKLFAQGRHGEIEEMWESCETEEEQNALRQQYTASLYQRAHAEHVRILESPDDKSLGELQEIANTLERILNINPTYTQALDRLGVLYADMVQAGAENPDDLFRQAIDRCQSALDIDENDKNAFFTWGYILVHKVQFATGETADLCESPIDLIDNAIDKWKRVLDIDPESHTALHNWGRALFDKVPLTSDDEAPDLLDEAIEKYRQCLAINPGDHKALSNLGLALSQRAQFASDDEAPDLLDEAIEKYRQCLDINPDDHEALHSWGFALSRKAQFAPEEEALDLLDEAIEKYQQSLDINPDLHRALNDCGRAFYEKAQLASDDEAPDLLDEAIEKYRRTLLTNPDEHKAIHNLGLALYRRAQFASDDEAPDLLDEAIEKYRQFLDINPDGHKVLYNLGLALSQRAQFASDDEALDLLDEAIEKYRRSLDINPDDHEALHSWGFALSRKAKFVTDDEAPDLLDEAIEKYQQSLDINPDLHRALNDCGRAFYEKAQLASDDEAPDLLDEAIEKYQHALEIKPGKLISLINWGYALNEKAEYINDEPEAERLRKEAEKRFEEAQHIAD